MRNPDSLIRLLRNNTIAIHPDGHACAVGNTRLCKDQSKFLGEIWMVGMDGTADLWTSGEYNDSAPQFGQDGTLYFLSNRATGQDDNHESRQQVFAFPPSGGEPRVITNEPLGVSGFRATPDGLVIVASHLVGTPTDDMRKVFDDRKKQGPSARRYTQMPVRFWDHWIPQAAPHIKLIRNGETTDLTPDADREYRNADWDVSADGRWLVTTRNRIDDDRLPSHDLMLFDLTTGNKRVLASDHQTNFWAPKISADGSTVVCLREARRQGAHGGYTLSRIETESGAITPIQPEQDLWFHPRMFLGPNSIACLADDQGATRLFEVNLQSCEAQPLTDSGTVHAADAANGVVIGLFSTILQPPEPCVIKDQVATPIAHISGYKPDADVVTESIWVESTDGKKVQGFVIKRKDTTQAPCMLAIHGGPISAWNDVWHWRWNARLLAEQGYVVAMPNPRGSTGFGQPWVEDIWGNQWGAQCYDDLMAFTDALAARPDVDADRMVALGGSFGGYMTNWIGCNTDRFRCLISHAGLTNLSGFHGVTDMPSWWIHMFGESPYKSPEAFDTYSPLRHIEGWKTPTLIVHGQKDYRVPVGEALTLFEALQSHDVESELLIFPDENHWILKPRNIVVWYEAVLDFARRFLG